MTVCHLQIPFNLKNCLLNCSHSSSCKLGCLFYSHITGLSTEKFSVDKQNIPNLNSSNELILYKGDCPIINLWWPIVLSKSNTIQSLYLVTISAVYVNNSYERNNSKEIVLGFVNENVLEEKETFLCNNIVEKSAHDIGIEFQLNAYPINYNGYNESIKLSSKLARCAYVSSSDTSYCASTLPMYLVGSKSNQLEDMFGFTSLDEEFYISFYIYPNKLDPGLYSLICVYTYDIVGCLFGITLWINEHYDVYLKIDFNFGSLSSSFNNSIAIKPNTWFHVEISQILKYIGHECIIKINGNVFYSEKNTQPQSYYDVSFKAFKDEKRINVLNSSIKSLFVINGILNNDMQLAVELFADYFHKIEETTLNRSSLLGTLNVMMKVYSVSFNVKSTKYTNGLKNVLHVTLGNNIGTYGDRNPGVFFHEDGSGKLVIFGAVNGNYSYYIETVPLLLNQWYSIKIYQYLVDSKYWFSIDLNGVNIHRVQNNDSREFIQMKVYISDPWYDAQDGSISDLLIVNGKVEYIDVNILSRIFIGRTYAEIPKLGKEYLILFEFKRKWLRSSKLGKGDYFSIRSDHLDFGVFSYYINLDIVNNFIYLTSYDFDKWLNIEVSQILKNMIYLYTIRINGVVKYSKVINQPQSYDNVKVYYSTTGSETEGSIKNLIFINDISSVNSQPVVLLTDIINQKEEFSLLQGFLIGTLNVLKKVYTIYFDIKPTNYTQGLKSVLCLSSNNNREAFCDSSVYIHEDGSIKLSIFSDVNNNSFIIKTHPLVLNQWSSIKISQRFVYSKYWLSVDFNGVNIHKVENFDAKDFMYMKVYASDPWYDAQHALISNLLIINEKAEYFVGNINTTSVKRKIICEIPKLYNEFLISFDLYPSKLDPGLYSIICIDFDLGDCRFEITLIIKEFNPIFQIRVVTNYFSTSFFNSVNNKVINLSLGLNFEIGQILEDIVYKFYVKINGYENGYNENVMYLVPAYYNNAKVYFSKSNSEVFDGLIKNFFVINGISDNSMDPVAYFPTDYINYKRENTVIQGSFFGTLNILKVFTISVNLKYSEDLKNGLFLTLLKDFEADGDINPGVWFYGNSSGKLSIFAALSGNVSYYIETPALTKDQWLNIKVYQRSLGGKYFLFVDINGVSIFKGENYGAKDFVNMKVYAPHLWYNAQNGFITDLLIINGKAEHLVANIIPLVKGKKIAYIPKLDVQYFISFDLYSNDFSKGKYNVLHFTWGFDSSDCLYSVPSIWFQGGISGELYISSLINSSCNVFNTYYFGLNQWSYIDIIQILKNSQYIYTVKINGEVAFSAINKSPMILPNVKFYASDPWNEVHNGLIKNVFIISSLDKEEYPDVIFPIAFASSQPSSTFASSQPSSKKTTIIVAIVAPALVTAFVVAAVLRFCKKTVKPKQIKLTPDIYRIENISCNDLLTDEWEIFPENIFLGKKIGEGAFGTVFVGNIDTRNFARNKNSNIKSVDFINADSTVAVKLLKDCANQSEFDDFREEIDLMKGIGYHKNIVNMIGCSTIKKPLYLIVEFMENGDLLHYLRNRRTKLCASKVDGESHFLCTQTYQQTLENTSSQNITSDLIQDNISPKEIGFITLDDLLSFAWQITSGMEYLSFKKLVHRDLAARNILIGAEKNVKISDFGLTRKINDELTYVSNKNRRLPLKWMSVEAIFDQMFTTSSDVWAYGIVLFEIVTLGGTPYPTINNRELLSLLKSGYRMERPENCSELMYNIMLQCWNEDPLKRPTFTDLREKFDEIIAEGDSYFNFNVDENKTYYNAASFKSLPSETCDEVIEDIFEKPVHVKSINENHESVHCFEERYTNQETCL